MSRTENVELTVLCLITDGDKMLLQNRIKNDWQGYTLPGGHVEPGESFVDAVIREMKEETGLEKEKTRLLYESKEWYSYVFPKPKTIGKHIYDGQIQKWFLFLYQGNGSDFNLEYYPEEIEFISYKWYPLREIVQYVVPFKRDVYSKVADEFEPIIQKFLSHRIDDTVGL